MFEMPGWKLISEAFPNNTVHFIGLLSDGGVHSRYDQLVLSIKVCVCVCVCVWRRGIPMHMHAQVHRPQEM